LQDGVRRLKSFFSVHKGMKLQRFLYIVWCRVRAGNLAESTKPEDTAQFGFNLLVKHTHRTLWRPIFLGNFYLIS
jgi:hypothetical protein